ncbi:MAG: histidine phosphatase family protein [Planctomycetota bacterium]|nr:histidine phosphatase family protein [Planctomycetota bacterium]
MRRPIPAPDLPDDPAAPRAPRALSTGRPARVWLVRHAEVALEWQERAYGDFDVPLSSDGMAQTRDMAGRFGALPIQSVASSNLLRALWMGRSIAELTRAPLTIDRNLREVSRGSWQGLPTAEFRARWAADAEDFRTDPWRWKGHGGESSADLFERAWPVVLSQAANARGGAVVIASHFNLIRALVTGALGLNGHDSFAFRIETARACLLVDDGREWSVPAQNVDDPRSFASALGATE